MVTLRRFVAMLLLAVFGLPVALSSLAVGQGTEAGLPACCRRTGSHHCAMSFGERSAAGKAAVYPGWKAPVVQCPYGPAGPALSAHAYPLLPAAVSVPFGHVSGPAAIVRRAECSRRLANERARGKRGPPSSLSA